MTAGVQIQPCPNCRAAVNTHLTLVKPKRRRRREKENPEYVAAIRDLIKNLVKRVGVAGDVEALADLAQLHEAVDSALQESINELRDRHQFSWAEIGRVDRQGPGDLPAGRAAEVRQVIGHDRL